ncbi:hypothetical protein AB1Y20_003130 [Prymnesium parvum]|uniref:Uncharacterized protein n=1 Tax=Prymnesium parvum TaxID=97485 RepID=A0AB34JBM5_PRYPA
MDHEKSHVNAERPRSRDVCLDSRGRASRGPCLRGASCFRATFARSVQNMLHKLPESSSILLVLDGAQWPLKAATHTSEKAQSKGGGARYGAMEANAANDPTTAARLVNKFFDFFAKR